MKAKIEFFKDIEVADVLETWDLRAALVLAFILSLVLYFFPVPSGALSTLLGVYIATGVGLFGVVIASFAIFTAMTEPRFLIFLEKANALKSYLSAFMVTAHAAIFTVAVSLVTYVLFASTLTWHWPHLVKYAIHGIALFGLIYALFAAAEVVKTISEYMRRRAKFYEVTMSKEDRELFERINKG